MSPIGKLVAVKVCNFTMCVVVVFMQILGGIYKSNDVVLSRGIPLGCRVLITWVSGDPHLHGIKHMVFVWFSGGPDPHEIKHVVFILFSGSPPVHQYTTKKPNGFSMLYPLGGKRHLDNIKYSVLILKFFCKRQIDNRASWLGQNK